MSIDDSAIEEIRAAGRDPDAAREQIAMLRYGPRPRALLRPCTIGDGILALDDEARQSAIDAFDRAAADHRIGAFIPASGAASRMFSGLSPEVLGQLRRAALWPSLGVRDDATADEVADALKRRFAGVPKALVPFHRYDAEVRTAYDEHLVEARALLGDGEIARVHFTVGSEHVGAFATRAMPPGVEARFSVQDPRTDTVAIEENGELARDNGRLIFRPGGHGALLGNLAVCARPLILVKNVDNVVPDERRGPVLAARKLVGGLLVQRFDRAVALVAALRAGSGVDEAVAFAREALGLDVPPDRDALIDALDRPMRVCGMVANDGQTGGGPFFLRGSPRPQIVEGAEVDLDDADQKAIWQASTHFNPVEIAVAIAGPNGRYALPRYADRTASIVTRKTHNGRPLTVIEHPGLWNGQMAGWNTIFVEVPREVFQPVKTVGDLTSPAHS